MTDAFALALDRTLRNEDSSLTGVVTNDPGDAGGVTRWGISQRFLDEIGSPLRAEALSLDAATHIYRTYFWDWYHLDALPPDLAGPLFDFLVTSHPQAAFLCLQRAVRANGGTLTEDGIFGPKTRKAMAACEPPCLLAAFRSERAGYYRSLSNARFGAGWVTRAYRA